MNASPATKQAPIIAGSPLLPSVAVPGDGVIGLVEPALVVAGALLGGYTVFVLEEEDIEWEDLWLLSDVPSRGSFGASLQVKGCT